MWPTRWGMSFDTTLVEHIRKPNAPGFPQVQHRPPREGQLVVRTTAMRLTAQALTAADAGVSVSAESGDQKRRGPR